MPMLRESRVPQVNSYRNSIQHIYLYHSPALLKMVNPLTFTGDSDTLMDKHGRGQRVSLLPGVLIYVLQETESIRCVCVYRQRERERKTYFKGLAHVIVGFGKSRIYMQISKLETEKKVDVLVSNPKAICRQNSLFLRQPQSFLLRPSTD